MRFECVKSETLTISHKMNKKNHSELISFTTFVFCDVGKTKTRIINMKNDKLFCSSELINGKMVMKNEKSANDAVIFYFRHMNKNTWTKKKPFSIFLLFWTCIFPWHGYAMFLCDYCWIKHENSVGKSLMNEFRTNNWKHTERKNKVNCDAFLVSQSTQ